MFNQVAKFHDYEVIVSWFPTNIRQYKLINMQISDIAKYGYRYIHITPACVHAGDISYVPYGASPRRKYFRIALGAIGPEPRVLYDFFALKARIDIWTVSTT